MNDADTPGTTTLSHIVLGVTGGIAAWGDKVDPTVPKSATAPRM